MHRRPAIVAVVAVGGAVGALARWGLEHAGVVADGRLPWMTLAVNVVGSALLGVLVVAAELRRWPAWTQPALGTGFLGGFTTFSTYVVQVTVLGHGGQTSTALMYAVLTPVLCLVAAASAGAATRLLLHGRWLAQDPDRLPG